MTLELEFGEEQEALAESVRGFCGRHCTREVVRDEGVPDELWRGLADLGVLALATPEGGGGALEIAAAMEELGAAVCPGPLVSTFFASQVLSDDERSRVVSGESVASVGSPPLMPWAPTAELFVEVTDGKAWRARPAGAVEEVETLGREPWGHVELERGEELTGFARAASLSNLSMAAYLAGAGAMLVRLAAEFAADRVQFGRAIGEFQGVSLPLAEVHLRMTAAKHLARVAAFDWDADDPAAGASAATARLSATRAALSAAYRAHQTFGAMGFTEEGPVGYVSQRIRQVSMLPPSADAARTEVLGRYGL